VRLLLGLVVRRESVARSAHSLGHRRASPAAGLVAQVADVDVDDVGAGVEVVVPDGGEDLLAAEDVTRVAHEVLQQGELAAGELHGLVVASDAARAQVHLQVAGLYRRRAWLIGAPGERSHAGRQFLQIERLGEVVIRAGIESVNLLAHVVAGGEHQHRHLWAPQSDALQDPMSVEPWQQDVQPHELDSLVSGQPRAVLPIIGAEALVTVGRQASLE
jgi:hypothetical protein